MLRKRPRILTALLVALVALLAMAGAAAAHPLGNFTVSRYSALTLRAAAVDVFYVIDMAEIPTLQERQGMDADGDGAISPAEEADWAAALLPDLAANLRLTVDGAAVPLTATSHALTFPPGQGDLPTLRLEARLTAALPPSEQSARAIAYEDANFAGRLGWQEVVAAAESGSLLNSSVPAAGISDELRAYPAGLLQAPPTVNRAEISYAPLAADPGGSGIQPAPAGSAVASANRFGSDEFANLLNRTLDTPGALAAALLVAVGLGAAHALTPGHGKTIVGAYLVGSRGKARHALILGVTTTITHTAGVFALGFLVLVASEFIQPEKLYPWLGVLSGLLVVFIGASILRGHVGHWLAHRRGDAHDHGHYHFHFGKGHSHGPAHHRAEQPARPAASPVRVLAYGGPAKAGTHAYTLTAIHPHDHNSHDHHDHGHGHSHDHQHHHAGEHRHSTAEQTGSDSTALSLKNLLALGISGGLLPCPSALILMLSAIALRQVGLGLTLIVAFSIGLAGVLTGIGLIMVYAGRFLERLPIRHSAVTTRLLPVVSATFITLAGLLITLRALGEAGIL